MIEIKKKPRLYKSGALWACVGLSDQRLFRGQKIITRFANTASSAYYEWLCAVITVKYF